MTDILLMERFPRGRPVREIRTPVNTRNCPRCDNGEGEVGTTSPLPSYLYIVQREGLTRFFRLSCIAVGRRSQARWSHPTLDLRNT